MNELIKVQSGDVKSCRIKNLDIENSNVLDKELAISVLDAYNTAGFASKPADITAIVLKIKQIISERYSAMTIREIQHAIRSGVLGDYGEYYGITVREINSWLKHYYDSPERQHELARQHEAAQPARQLPSPRQPSDTETQALRRSITLAAWDTYKSQNYCRDTGNVAYNFLEESGLMPFSYQEFTTQAKAQMTDEAKARSKNFIQVHIALNQITENALVPLAKRHAVNAFFARLKQEKKELNV